MERQQIRQAGLKVTHPRVKILKLLESCDKRHLSADDIYTELHEHNEEIGLATVYRVLTQFEEAGLVCRLQFVEGQSVFEMDRGVHHDHLICAKCGKIEEFVDETIEERQRIIAADNAFRLTDHRLLIYGICADCRNESDSDQAR